MRCNLVRERTLYERQRHTHTETERALSATRRALSYEDAQRRKARTLGQSTKDTKEDNENDDNDNNENEEGEMNQRWNRDERRAMRTEQHSARAALAGNGEPRAGAT